ncbi:hypothetical protein C8C83_4500 [Flavobacterium sp. 90]|uniref:hypothetical protein n=1 Tax=unclassified Flavobacterium TaxID=196869 RepID=UPI000F2A972B|nr:MULTISPECIES: hypothetical protein [unclassified Flavobacterium]RKR05167.1 hypothetical protein C8C82_4841 [Flavobacterium sp. 81]TCK56483.1 hypothetical protein C8C83_4500 [Flavobacterium sp. 90]
MTPSEKYVAELCEQSFLPFWSFPNPIGKKGKELCDVLVVCGNIIIIISVKDIRVSENNNELVQYDRWVKKAIHDSIDQIHGAERYLSTVDEVLLKNKKTNVKLPDKKNRIIHRIAIAFGSPATFPLPTGEFDKGYVHVFDEISTSTILTELDAIVDFTNYLTAKREFVGNKTILIPNEIDFLAYYIQTGLEDDITSNAVIYGENLWNDYINSNEYSKWQDDVRGSYIWDNMIHHIHSYHITDSTSNEKREEIEEAIRTINLEPRINRIELGFILNNAIKRKVKARILKPINDAEHAYVFMPLTDKNWKEKQGELELRCTVARYENPTAKKIIGISIGSNSDGDSCFDICSLYIPEIDEDFIREVMEIKKN